MRRPRPTLNRKNSPRFSPLNASNHRVTLRFVSPRRGIIEERVIEAARQCFSSVIAPRRAAGRRESTRSSRPPSRASEPRSTWGGRQSIKRRFRHGNAAADDTERNSRGKRAAEEATGGGASLPRGVLNAARYWTGRV